jgi:hypothetical protein
VPRGVQLRLRRCHQHLHLRRRSAIPHYILPSAVVVEGYLADPACPASIDLIELLIRSLEHYYYTVNFLLEHY